MTTIMIMTMIEMAATDSADVAIAMSRLPGRGRHFWRTRN
jgi:hypothetical protein